MSRAGDVPAGDVPAGDVPAGGRESTPERQEIDKGRFAYHALDRVLHERARLGILSCLASSPIDLTFSDLKDMCELTDGNLNRHLHSLEEAGLVERVKKSRKARQDRPLTFVRFTAEGRERFLDYVDLLETIARESAEALRKQVSEDGRTPMPIPEGGSA